MALLALFVAVQAARREPLMRLSIFRAPNLAAANVAQLLLGAAWIPMWLFVNLYLQQVLGYGAFEGGAALPRSGPRSVRRARGRRPGLRNRDGYSAADDAREPVTA